MLSLFHSVYSTMYSAHIYLQNANSFIHKMHYKCVKKVWQYFFFWLTRDAMVIKFILVIKILLKFEEKLNIPFRYIKMDAR